MAYELNNNNWSRGRSAPFGRSDRILFAQNYCAGEETFYRDRHQADDGRRKGRSTKDNRGSKERIRGKVGGIKGGRKEKEQGKSRKDRGKKSRTVGTSSQAHSRRGKRRAAQGG